jgi:hypothetical protein
MKQLALFLVAALVSLNSVFADETKGNEPAIDKKKEQVSTDGAVKKSGRRVPLSGKNFSARNKRIQSSEVHSSEPLPVRRHIVFKNPAWQHVTPELTMQKNSGPSERTVRVRRSPNDKLPSLRKEIVIDASTAWILNEQFERGSRKPLFKR